MHQPAPGPLYPGLEKHNGDMPPAVLNVRQQGPSREVCQVDSIKDTGLDETHTEDARCTFSTISAPTSSPIAAARRLLLPAGAASDASTGWHAHTLAHTLGKRREVPEDSCTVEGPAWKRHASRGSALLGSAAAAAVGEGEGEEDEEEDDAVSRLGQAPLLTHPPPALPRLRAPAAPPAASPPPPPQGEAMCEDAASPPSSSDNDDGFWGPFIPAGGLRGPLDFEE